MSKKKREPIKPSDGLSLQLTWSTSRGADTYGYNICTLRVHGERIASTCGGGYDMTGTVLGDFIQEAFQRELVAMATDHPERFAAWFDEGAKKSRHVQDEHGRSPRGSLYGATVYTRPAHPGEDNPASVVLGDNRVTRVVLDGGCGESSMRTILNALGWEWKWVGGTSRGRGDVWYTLAKLSAPVLPS